MPLQNDWFWCSWLNRTQNDLEKQLIQTSSNGVQLGMPWRSQDASSESEVPTSSGIVTVSGAEFKDAAEWQLECKVKQIRTC